MFSIYGETGRVFRGAMEDLWHIDAVRKVARTRAVGTRNSVAMPGVASPGARTGAGAGNLANLHATAAYQQAAQPAAAARHPLTHVRDVMNRNPLSVTSDLSLVQAWRQLEQHGVGQAPVLDARGSLVGMLTRAELLRLDQLPQPDTNPLVWRALLMQPVSSVMLTPVPAVDPETALRRVARVLLDTHLPGLPVVDAEGALSGFISRSDILRAVVHDPPLDLWS